MVECPSCRLVLTHASFCPRCGRHTSLVPQKSAAPKVLFWVVVFVVVASGWIFTPLGKALLEATPSGVFIPGDRSIRYLVDGSSRTASVTFTNESGGTGSLLVTLPWTLRMRRAAGTFLYVAAQKKGSDGTVHAAIYVDGDVIQQAESDTPYGIASASGRVH